ncbi:39S ribosomal protein L21, mitochondrial [Daktulosphaira vitifoliae]|uniref:39S ribosomal protein L21, mitochondrial n=1 Tax=Daktulosphaira vitifoliae TaxID=58002 RepID=UPI0021A9BC3B|nr:39S ribosomal protein L21, mitochondrial [Daktulosphaira vitifoliae]
MFLNNVCKLVSKTFQNVPSSRTIISNPSLRTYGTLLNQEYIVENKEEDNKFTNEVLKNVNEAIKNSNRLFAVVHICGKQFKVTDNDLVLIDGYWPPNVGDRVKFQKVLLAGGIDFTLIGTPILDPDTVHVNATVVDKDLSHTRTNFKRLKRKQYMRINFIRKEITTLRINSIRIVQDVGNRKDIQSMGMCSF